MKVMRQIVVVVGIIALSASLATAQPGVVGPRAGGQGRMGPGMRGPGRNLDDFWTNPEVIEKLGLTGEQVEQLEAVSVERQKSQIQRRSQAEMLKLEIEQLWKAEPLDETAVKNKVQQVAQLMEEGMLERTQYRIEVYHILTPQQRGQVQEYRQQMKQRFKKRLQSDTGGGRRRPRRFQQNNWE